MEGVYAFLHHAAPGLVVQDVPEQPSDVEVGGMEEAYVHGASGIRTTILSI
jgi:hypothetical protein